MRAFVVLLMVATASMVMAGPKWEFGEDGYLKASILGQVHYSFKDNAADESDFFLRRGRLILSGQITDGVKVFLETDNDNLGRNGVSSSTDIQDAFVDFRLLKNDHAEAWVSTGLILLPFSL